MRNRIDLTVTMELLSDTIFGSGHSIPGGEDIAVCLDENGYPYMKGSTLKGLLRESMENWLSWTGEDPGILGELMGEGGWNGITDDRRVQVTELTLKNKPSSAESCLETRCFTKMDKGIAESGALREAVCISSGLLFQAHVFCAEEDVQLVEKSLQAVKWVGTMRSRGFGRVRIRAEKKRSFDTVMGGTAAFRSGKAIPYTGWIHYCICTELPLLITDLNRSFSNGLETQSLIPGSAVRGMVISRLAAAYPAWFKENRRELLSENTRFLDALPNSLGFAALPSIKGFYEDKNEENFQTVLLDGELGPKVKRAGLGNFCALVGSEIRYWSAKTEAVMRLNRSGDGSPFRVRALSAGQVFEGYMEVRDAGIAEKILEIFKGDVWIGADRYEGFGKCHVEFVEAVNGPAWLSDYGYTEQEKPGNHLYLLALSPFTMLDETGNPCGLDLKWIAKKLGVSEVKAAFCSTSVSEYGGYNRVWECRQGALRMYDRGSIFHLTCSEAPKLSGLLELQKEGIGVRRAEGFGQILFLRSGLFEGLDHKKALKPKEKNTNIASARRAKYQWIMERKPSEWRGRLSKSQVGELQVLCEQAIAMGGNCEKLLAFLEKNKARGTQKNKGFEKTESFVRGVLETPLSKTTGADCEDSKQARLELLCMLFDDSRRAGKGEK